MRIHFTAGRIEAVACYHWDEPVSKMTPAFLQAKKTAAEAAVITEWISDYAALRLATATRPSRPEPNSQTAAGTGIICTSTSITLAPVPKVTE